MSVCCPLCGGTWVPAEVPPVLSEDDPDVISLHEECRRRGYWISPDGGIREKDAADLMGLAPKTLRNRRSLLDNSLPAFKIRNRRALYSITSLAEWLRSA